MNNASGDIVDFAVPYHELGALADYYLEDSYVIAIRETGNSLTFELDVVLCETHPAYAPPKPNEQYCYADATLLFANVTRARWFERRWTASIDATGAYDMGNIDSLHTDGRGGFMIEGDWGSIELHSDAPRISLRPSPQSETP